MFAEFVDRIAPGGFLVAGVDDSGVRTLLDRMRAETGGVGLPRIIGYGRAIDADLRVLEARVTGTGGAAEVSVPGGGVVEIVLAVPGEHMLANATAALAAGMELGVDPQVLAEGLAGFSGVRRRFEFKGSASGIRVYDDYAHHPTEVAATIAAARGVAGAGRLVVVFQPHLYSRTQIFAEAFGVALSGADVVVVLDVYGAREDPRPGVTGTLVADAVPAGTALVHYVPSLAEAPKTVVALLRSGDLVMTMGAGDVTMLGPQLLDRLQRGRR